MMKGDQGEETESEGGANLGNEKKREKEI